MITQDPPRGAQDLLEGAQDLPRSAPDLLEGTLAAFVRVLLSSFFSLFSQLLDPGKCTCHFVTCIKPSNPLKSFEESALLAFYFLASSIAVGLFSDSTMQLLRHATQMQYMDANLIWALIEWSR